MFISQKALFLRIQLDIILPFQMMIKIDEIKFKDVIKKFKLEDLINENPEKEFFNLEKMGKIFQVAKDRKLL